MRVARAGLLTLWAAAAVLAQDAPPQAETGKSAPVPTQAAPSSVLDRRDKIYYPSDTERFKPLMHKLGANVLLDQADIWTSPLRINRHNVGWWLGFAGVTAGLIASDNWTSKQLENSPGQVRWGGRISKVGASYTLIPLVFGFYGYGAWKDDPKARETGILGAEALIDALVVVQGMKLVARRKRPDAECCQGDFFSGGTSFPSGHSMESWALASVIAHEYNHYKFAPILAYSLATVVSAARFAGQKHYASDIVLGAGVGWFIGRYVYQTHVNHSIHRHAALTPQVVPMVDPGSRTYGLSLAWGR
jgi:uncharacterized membrane protein